MGTIANGADRSIAASAGTLPQMGGAMRNWFQAMSFDVVTKTTVGFQVKETMTNVEFRGVIQPFQAQRLAQKPEGQRAWTWLLLHSEPVLSLKPDDVVIYKGKQTRVMALKDYSLNGFLEYELVQDYTGAGPTVLTP